jgi:hypothetical protein
MKWVFAEDWPGETPPPWGMGAPAPHGAESESEHPGPGDEGIERSAD